MASKTLEDVLSELSTLPLAKSQSETVKLLIPSGLDLSVLHSKAAERGYVPDGFDTTDQGLVFRYVPRFSGHRHLGYYNELQNRIFDIFLYVSCDQRNFGVFSIALASLFLDAASYFDSLSQNFIIERSEAGNGLKSAAAIKDLTRKTKGKSFFTIDDYRACFEAEFAFSVKTLNLNTHGDNFHSQPIAYLSDPTRRCEITPFSEWAKGKNPDWWTAYNGVKHDRIRNMESATLGNTVSALGAVLVVLCFFHERFLMSGSRGMETFRLLTPCFWKLGGSAMIAQPFFQH